MDLVCGIASGIVTDVGKLLFRPVGQRIWYMFKFKSNVQQLQEREKRLTEKKENVLLDVEVARRREDIIKDEVQEWLAEVDKFTNRLANVTNQENKQCFKGCPNLKTLFFDSKEAVQLVNECDRLTQRNFQSVYWKNHARELKQREKVVRHRVEKAERQGDTIEAEVHRWLAEVDDLTKKLENVTNEENKQCFTRCPNLKTRFVDSKEALVKECDSLLTQGNFPEVSHRSPPSRARSMYVKEDDAFNSRESVFNEVMEALKNYNIKVIGLHGMGGVGKTTLVKKVYWQLTDVHKLFDQVVMAEVSQNPDLIKVQDAIADHLGLELQEKSVDERASRIRQMLKGKKSVLVILDDVWKELDLKQLGIPFGNADQRHCRILVTSRYKNVCSSMKSEKYISIEPLSYDEAWVLFWKTVDDGEKQSQTEPIAENIVKKCGGLPVAILAIAKTLRGSDPFVWNKVSNELANFDCSDAVPNFYPVLKLSYDYLENKKAKLLFLLFGLHEVGHPVLIDHLVRCVIGLGFLQCVTTLKAARDDVDQLIKVLKNANLLLDSDRKDEVKVHDVIHVVAQKIASTEHKMFNIQDVVYLNEELEKDIYRDSTAISLHHGEVPMLLEKLDFPQLKLLFLHSRSYYQNLEIPDHFLDGMKELRVLVLNRVDLQSFIPSLNYESNIRTLSLKCYNLENITKVGMLKKLEVLTFSGSAVKRLPEEIGDLTRLKLLDLEGCYWLEEIPPDVISKLTRLEELYVSDSFVHWDTPGNASLIELKQLDGLTILCIRIMDANIIPQDFFLEKLEGFKIFIGEAWRSNAFEEREMSRVLRLKLSHKNYLQCGVEKLMQKTEGLFLDEIDGIRNVHPKLGGKGFPDLKHLCIRDYSHLEKLCDGDSREGPFRMLKEIDVEHCPHLKFMFSSSMVNGLQQLEKIRVVDCRSMEVIIKEEGSSGENNFNSISFFDEKKLCHNDSREEPFRKLRVIVVQRCAALTQLISYSVTRLEEIEVIDCPHLKFMFSSSMVNSLQQLKEIRVEDCKSMEVIIKKEGSSGENNFNSISFFDEKVCDSVEDIFDVPEGSSSIERNKIRMIIFPKLTRLSLFGLTKLKSFYNGLHISEWPSLKQLRVECCHNVEIFGLEYQSFCEEKQSIPQPLFVVDKYTFPRLDELELRDNDNLKEIWHGGGIISNKLQFRGKTNILKFPHYLLATDTLDVSSGYFKQIGGGSDNTFAAALSQLRTLRVSGDDDDDDDDELHESFESCDSLACLVSSWVSFQNLTKLDITCGFRYLLTYSTATSLQHLTQLKISDCKQIEVIIMPPTNEVNDKIVFSQLKNLRLINLDSLTSFYSGSHTLEFPSLEIMVVCRCPNMKVFSEGDLITQKLQRIQLHRYYDYDRHLFVDDYDEWRWEGDLNSTIQKMCKEMAGFKDLKKFRLSKFPWLKEVWHDQVSFNSFPCLESLTVDKCADMSSAIPLNLLPCLESLYRLTIEDCDSLEEVIHTEGLDDDDQSVLLPWLHTIQLIKLPRLRNVWSKHHLEILGFTKLSFFSVSKCNNLQYIFTTKVILNLKLLVRVEIRDCAMLETIIIEDREKDATMSDIVLPWLRFITLEYLPKLTCFHSGSNILKCSVFETMTINDCPQMKAFVFTSIEDHDLQNTPLFSEKVAFPNLKKLELSKLPMVERLWNEPCRVFQCLETIEISECVTLKSLVPSSTSLQSLTTLKISQCDGLTSLMTLTTAKSLEQLDEINVADCKNMQEIITHIHIEDEENDRVVFGQLDYIGLHCLPNITGFYLGDYTIEFPDLEQVVVSQCQKMNTFSKGAVSTPNLKMVQRTDDEEEGRWQNDLNTTIQLLFEEINAQNQKED